MVVMIVRMVILMVRMVVMIVRTQDGGHDFLFHSISPPHPNHDQPHCEHKYCQHYHRRRHHHLKKGLSETKTLCKNRNSCFRLKTAGNTGILVTTVSKKAGNIFRV